MLNNNVQNQREKIPFIKNNFLVYEHMDLDQLNLLKAYIQNQQSVTIQKNKLQEQQKQNNKISAIKSPTGRSANDKSLKQTEKKMIEEELKREPKKFGLNNFDFKTIDNLIMNYVSIQKEIDIKDKLNDDQILSQRMNTQKSEFQQSIMDSKVSKPSQLQQQQQKSLKCPYHQDFKPDYFCVEELCPCNTRVMCQQCILRGPHKIHDNKFLQEVLYDITNLKEPLEAMYQAYSGLEEQIEEGFTRIKKLFGFSIDMIKEHYFSELEADFKQLDFLKNYMENTQEQNFQKKIFDKQVNDEVLKSVTENNEEFLKSLKPNKEKLDLFFLYFNDHLMQLEQETQSFIKKLYPKFLKEVNYTRYAQKAEFQVEQNIEHDLSQDIKQTLIENIKIEGKIQFNLQGHTGVINDIKQINENLIASCSQDGQVHIWNLLSEDYNKLVQLIQEDFSFRQIAYLPPGYLAVMGNFKKEVNIYDISEGIIQNKIKLNDYVSNIFSDSAFLYITTDSGKLLIYDGDSLEQTFERKIHDSMIMVIKADQRIIVTGDQEGNIQILFKINDYQVREESLWLKNHRDSVLDLQIFDDKLVSTSLDRRVLLWDINKVEVIKEIVHYDYSLEGIKKNHNDVLRTWKIQKYNENIVILLKENNVISFYEIQSEYFLKDIDLGSVLELEKINQLKEEEKNIQNASELLNSKSNNLIDKKQTFLNNEKSNSKIRIDTKTTEINGGQSKQQEQLLQIKRDCYIYSLEVLDNGRIVTGGKDTSIIVWQ